MVAIGVRMQTVGEPVCRRDIVGIAEGVLNVGKDRLGLLGCDRLLGGVMGVTRRILS